MFLLESRSFTDTHHSVTMLETELITWLDVDLSFVWDRLQNPTPEADGTLPKQDDFYVIFGLGVDM